MEGGGATAESWMGHWDESVEVRGVSFLLSAVAAGVRREREWTLDIEESERRFERMCEP